MSRLAQNPQVICTELEDGAVLLNMETRTYYSLTDQGRERFLTLVKRWASLNDAVQSLAADTRPPASS